MQAGSTPTHQTNHAGEQSTSARPGKEDKTQSQSKSDVEKEKEEECSSKEMLSRWEAETRKEQPWCILNMKGEAQRENS